MHFNKEKESMDTIIKTLHQSLLVNYVFQPVFNANGNIVFFEILGRVKDKGTQTIKAVSPEIAQKFTKLLLFFTCNIVEHDFLGDYKVSINLSRTEVNDDIVDLMIYLFAKSKISHKIIVEVTEDVLIDSKNANFLLKLKRNNFCIALDDFCSEKSVRDIICDFDFIDIIKFDGVFMSKIGSIVENAALIDGLKHLNSFAKSLGKQTVIEHIESKNLFDVTINSGADFFQGFYLGKPLSLEYYERTKYNEAINS